MSYRLKKGAAEGVYAIDGHNLLLLRGQKLDLNPTQASAFASVVELDAPAKPKKAASKAKEKK